MDDITKRDTPRSGRFVLRIDPGLHAALRAAARAERLSLNDYCARKLALPGSGLAGPAWAAVQQATALLGSDLVGIAAYGSWARGEARPESDVDLLLVVESGVEITRALYRGWDAQPLHWEGRVVEPHFVHLPKPDARITGLWAEAAVDGVVLFERELELSRHLAQVRRRILAGEVQRRWVHGQPYWVEAA
jgi:predicted nucleotidyltransferase